MDPQYLLSDYLLSNHYLSKLHLLMPLFSFTYFPLPESVFVSALRHLW